MSQYLLSFDVEDWFHAHNLRPVVERDGWEDCEQRVERNVGLILDLLEKHDTKATFFILGWVAENHPQIVESIAAQGHEIASHGYNHKLLYEQSDEAVRADIRRSKDILESIIDQPIRGYRAPSFSITDSAIETLAELGFEYDSSSFQVSHHDRYGKLEETLPKGDTITSFSNGLIEARLPQLDIAGKQIPWAGGGYFRFLPYRIFRWGIHRISNSNDFIFYLHPWELDPAQPHFDTLPLSYRIRHYTNLDSTERKLDQLLADFDWEPIEQTLTEN